MSFTFHLAPEHWDLESQCYMESPDRFRGSFYAPTHDVIIPKVMSPAEPESKNDDTHHGNQSDSDGWSNSSSMDSSDDSSSGFDKNVCVRIHPQKGGRSSTKLRKCLYKTEMCENWIKYKSCAYGKKCQFAHGKRDLRKVPHFARKKRLPYVCKNFIKMGTCPYGKRCMFRHPTTHSESVPMAEKNTEDIV